MELGQFSEIDSSTDEGEFQVVVNEPIKIEEEKKNLEKIELYEENEPLHLIEFDQQKFLGVCFISLVVAVVIMAVIGFLKHPLIGALFIFAIIPSVIILAVLIKFKRKKISTELTFELFWSGLLITFLVVIIQSFLTLIFYGICISLGILKQKDEKLFEFEHKLFSHLLLSIYTSFIVAGFVEECAKYYMIFRVRNREEFLTPESSFVYTISGSLGFATLENVAYVVLSSIKDPQGQFISGVIIAIGRSLLSVPLHCITGSIIGLRFSRVKFFKENLGIIDIIYPSIFIHGLYDFILMFMMPYENLTILSLLFCILIVVLSGFYSFKEFVRIQYQWDNKPPSDIIEQEDQEILDVKEDNQVAIF